jgi:hypothetical protein
MRFYVIEDSGETIGCELTLAAAHDRAASRASGEYEITALEVPVTAESIRRLLGGLGGYATNCGDAITYINGKRTT